MTSSSASFAELDRFVAVLESRVQKAIAQTTKYTPPIIRCRFQQQRLLLLSEATQVAATASKREARFRALMRAIDTELTAMELPSELLNSEGKVSMRLYLRQRGTASPYAARTWSWQPTDGKTQVSAPSEERSSTDPQTPHIDETNDRQPEGAIVLLSTATDVADAASTISPIHEADAIPETHSVHLHPRWWQRWYALTTSQDWPWRSLVGLVIIGLTVGGISYGVSRPCLVGSCDRRQTASDLSQTALTQLQGKPTLVEVNRAHADLQEAIRLLSGIPLWSSHYDTAQADLQRYRTQLADLEWIMLAQKNATTASEKSQNPPHPVPLWVEVHLLWQKAVTALRRVPEASPLADFAQRKLTEYETNYQAIGQRLAVEERAEASINDALQAGQMATTRTEKASTLSEWLLAQGEWQQAINALNRIPKGTLAYTEARSLLQEYRIHLIQTRTRVNLEKAGDRVYRAGLTTAAKARAAERKNQWALAVEQWRFANAQMRQVSQDTAHYTEAQNQLKAYQVALKQAENRLKQAVAFQTIEEDLVELCPLEAGICTFTYSTRQIELILRDPYDNAIRQSISPPSTQSHFIQTNSVVKQTHQLVQDIMRLGNHLQLPISLYDIDQQFIAQYRPDYGGFVKE